MITTFCTIQRGLNPIEVEDTLRQEIQEILQLKVEQKTAHHVANIICTLAPIERY
jgi:hypothetical protein